MSQHTAAAAGVRWDLSDLFASHDDPAIDATVTACRTRAEEFAGRYRGTILAPGGPAPDHLLGAILEMEGIQADLERVGAFAGLLYASDTSRPEFRDLRERVEQHLTEIGNLVLFFELEWLQVAEDAAAPLLDHPALAGYRHFLRQARQMRPHTLSEPEERLLNERDNTGLRAFGRLFTELTSSLDFPFRRDGREERLTLSEILALYHEPDRELRKRAHDSLFSVLERNGQVLTFTYDTLVQDGLTMGRLRDYPNPMTPRHLSNEIDAESVDQMMKVVEANYGIAHDYFRAKAAARRAGRADDLRPVRADRREARDVHLRAGARR